MPEPHNTPSEANAEDGAVIVDGPGGIAYAMTPAAAHETAHRIEDCASGADEQRDGEAEAPPS